MLPIPLVWMNGGQLRGLRELQHMYKTIDSIRTQVLLELSSSGFVGAVSGLLKFAADCVVEHVQNVTSC